MNDNQYQEGLFFAILNMALHSERKQIMMIDDIREQLFSLQDADYRDFQSKLIPGVPSDAFIGVRTPALRKLAKDLSKEKEISVFLEDLPHKYFDENQLHAFIISLDKDFSSCIGQTEKFLPFIDNWATCDQLSPKVFRKHRPELAGYIKNWLSSEETYTVRFAIGMIMEHFLDEDFDPQWLETVSKIRSDEYYINMMTAWYFATALAKQYEHTIPYLEEKKLDSWTHNKTIQKAAESFRITPDQKEYLRTLKIPKGKE